MGQGRVGSTEKKQVVWAEPWHCPSSVTKDRLGAAQYMVLKQLPPRQQKVSALTNLGFLPKTECNDPKSSFSSLVPCGCLFSASGSSSILKKIVAPWAWICPATSCPQHAPLPMSPGQLPGQQENIHRQESASGTPGWLQALSVGWCLPWKVTNTACSHKPLAGKPHGWETPVPDEPEHWVCAYLGVSAQPTHGSQPPSILPTLHPCLTEHHVSKIASSRYVSCSRPPFADQLPKNQVWGMVGGWCAGSQCLLPRAPRCSVGTGSVLGKPQWLLLEMQTL